MAASCDRPTDTVGAGAGALSAPGLAFLGWLPGFGDGRLGVHWVDERGDVLESRGVADDLEFDHAGELGLPDGRVGVQRTVGTDGCRVVVVADAAFGDQLATVVGPLLEAMAEKAQLEHDMESMYASSLALLEQVSMAGEIMPKLPTGQSEEEIARMGLEALAVAASVERAVYVRYVPELDQCEVLVQVVQDDGGVSVVPWAGDPIVDANVGVVARSISIESGGALVETRAEFEPPSSTAPEAAARAEWIAAPVCYGVDKDRRTLGLVLAMDKRATSYSNASRLGSEESKTVAAVASMLGAVLGTRKAAELGKELKTAEEIQRTILPERPAAVDRFELAGRCANSGAVGGDYFDYMPMVDGRTLAVVADVSGHNLASGMLMVSARATLRLLASKSDSVGAVFSDLAASLYDDLSRTERFITAAAVAMSPVDDVVEIVNAGHNDTLVFRAASGRVERIPSEDTILGFLPDMACSTQRLHLADGDVAVLYTDGMTEATNAAGEMFDEDRLAAVLAGVGGRSAEAILDALFGAVAEFADRAADSDDATAVVIRRLEEGGR